jgi:predicted RNA-binding Zn-ribbon protein involved in translation (DUF1610 family)
MTEFDNDLLRYALIHLKAGEVGPARNYLERALMAADDWDTKVRANFAMSQLAETPEEARHYLEQTLAFDPAHAEARKQLAILDGKLKADDIVDPDALPAQSTVTRSVQADRFTCPKCGGRMTYAPDGRSLTCEYCSRSNTLEAALADQAEQDFILAMATGKGHRKPVAMQTFHCKGCGADFLLGPTEKSVICSYCGSAHVVRGEDRELVEPDRVIPMAITQREAAERLVKWVEKYGIQPQGKVKAPRGIYLPVWTFDISGNVPWKGYVYRGKLRIDASGDQVFAFDDIPVPAVSRWKGLLHATLGGFHFPASAAYDARYLAGWPAEVYDRAMSDASLDARQSAVKMVRCSIAGQVGKVLGLTYSTTGLTVLSFKLVLTPLWVTKIQIAERKITVLINGATGAVDGDVPARGVIDWLEGLFA